MSIAASIGQYHSNSFPLYRQNSSQNCTSFRVNHLDSSQKMVKNEPTFNHDTQSSAPGDKLGTTTRKTTKIDRSPHIVEQTNTTAVVQPTPQSSYIATGKLLVHDQVANCVSRFADSTLLHSGHLKDVLRCLLKPPHDKDVLTFTNISPEEFEIIQRAVEETASIRIRKPRLTFIRDSKLLLIKMSPSRVHNTPIHALTKYFMGLFSSLPLGETTVDVEVSCGHKIITDRFSGEPDLVVSFSQCSVNGDEKITFIAEVAFSQTRDDAINKLKAEVESHKEVKMALLVVVQENPPYRAPKYESDTWETFRQHDALTVRDFNPDEEQSPLRVVVGGHTWCCISSVEYYLWIQREGPIDFDRDDEEHMSYGTLLPSVVMEPVENMFQEGVEKIRDHLVEFCKSVGSAQDYDSLQSHLIHSTFDTNIVLFKMKTGVRATAHDRYMCWFQENFRGTKRDRDDDFRSSNDGSDSDELPPVTRKLRSGRDF